MIDPNLKEQVELLVQKVQELNELMCSLHESKIDVRLSYRLEENAGRKPNLVIISCMGHDDYLS